MRLNDKQERFCQEYLLDLNAKQAAIRAGYSPNTAAEIGCENMAKPEISSYIERLKASRSQRIELDQDYVLRGLKEVAERCMQRIPVLKWDYTQKRMVQETVQDENGIEQGVWKFDSGGACKAFELIGKHLGVFEKDNKQRRDNQPPFSDDQVDRIINTLNALDPAKVK